MKTYIVTFEKEGILDSFNYVSFHEKLTTAQGVISWWHYLGTTYILSVPDTATATSVTQYILAIAPNKKFFVAKVDLKDHGGWLPKEAWDWINNQTSSWGYK